jgi:LPS-assembly protein
MAAKKGPAQSGAAHQGGGVRRFRPSDGVGAGTFRETARRGPSLCRAVLAGVALLFGLMPAAWAANGTSNLIADEVGYDQDLGVYVARGHVEMSQDDRIVMADTVTYNERSKTISASGNVVLLMPSGDTLFGNYVDVTDDFNNGVIRSFRALMQDKSRLAAYSAQRIGGTKMVLNKAVYTPCLPCRNDPTRQPVWQIKADQVVRDTVAKTITYHNAWMEMWGVPVFYTPYFQHPDVGVTRQTGLLNPSFSVSSGSSGVQIRQPYFVTLGDDKDVTLTPIARIAGTPSPGAGVLLGQFRQRAPNGAYQFEASSTYESTDSNTSDRQFRGHIAGDGLFDVNRDWRWGFTFKNTTDKQYLRTYHLGSSRWLEDQLWTEGFFGRSYFEARGYGWQSTKSGVRNATTPIVAPLINYDFVGEPGAGGGYWGLKTDLMNLVRRDGRDSFRVAMLPTWTLPYTSSFGDVYELKLSVAADMYITEHTDPGSDDVNPSGVNTFNGLTGRVFPQASLKWRYPWVYQGSSFTQVVQPIAQLVLSPNCCNTGKIPNEDSRTFEWDETKLFSADRFSGLDRVDAGSRVNYGMQWSAYNGEGGRAEVFLGQSYQFIRSHDEPAQSGIRSKLTDVVGRVTVAPASWLDTTYRFRFNADQTKMERQEVDFSAGVPELDLSLAYVQLAGNADFGSRQQLSGDVSTKIYDYWSASAGLSYDFTAARIDGVNATFGYNDECFGLNLSAQYNPDGQTELSSGKFTAFITFSFKNLGDIGTSF